MASAGLRSKYLPILVLLGCVSGVLIGLFLPQLANFISPVGHIYIRLMEVVVLPYIISSLVLGLGQLAPQTALKLFRKSWVVYVALWTMSLAVIIIVASTVPLVKQAAVINFAATLGAVPSDAPSLIELLIPNNFFQALTNNYVPSIVLIGIIYGVAVQHIEKRGEFLNILSVIRGASVRIWGWVVYLAPIGVCSLFADTLSSMDPDGLAAMSLYMIVVTLSALLIGLWLLPMLLTSFLPMRYWEIMTELKEAFLISIVTSLSVASLPMIQTAAQNMAKKYCGNEDEKQQKEIIQTTLSISYPLAQVGNFFIMAFLFYASFYFFVPFSVSQLFELPFVTLLSGVGSPSSSIGAVAFMAEWLNMPSETTNLYVETMSLTRYAQVLASVAAFAFVTILVTFIFYGRVRLDLKRLIMTLAVTAVCLSGIWSVGRWGGTHIQLHSLNNYLAMGLPDELQAFSDANLVSNLASKPDEEISTSQTNRAVDKTDGTLDRIQSSGVLRIGINPNVMPFSYINTAKELVGYDVEMMYRFADSMNVELKFVAYTWQELVDDLEKSKFDIAVGGIYITDDRLRKLTVSDPYYENPLALIVKTSDVGKFSSRELIDGTEGVNIAVFNDPVLLPQAKRSFPNATVTVLDNYDKLESQTHIDAALWTLEQARAWAISHEGYSAVVPKNTASRFLFGYLMAPNSPGLSDYLNYWMGINVQGGVQADMAKRWIDPAATDARR